MADRLLLSEAIEAVSRMIRGYANAGSAGQSYIGAMADLLMRYPRQIALGCADPFKGVARDTRFLPTPADVIAWCERAVEPMYEEAAREDRVVDQLRARAEWQNNTPSDRLKALGAAWLDRTDPIAKALTQAAGAETDAEAQRRRDRTLDMNRAFFLRECEREGIDPARGVTPSLLKLLERQNVHAE